MYFPNAFQAFNFWFIVARVCHYFDVAVEENKKLFSMLKASGRASKQNKTKNIHTKSPPDQYVPYPLLD